MQSAQTKMKIERNIRSACFYGLKIFTIQEVNYKMTTFQTNPDLKVYVRLCLG